MKKKKIKPPGIPKYFFDRFVIKYTSIPALGDLDEEFYLLCDEKSVRKARRWYWKQFIKSLPHLVNNLSFWSLTMFKNYFKIAFRNILRQKGYSFINISGLAAGMACCLLILIWVQDELSYEDFHDNAPNIYRILERSQEKWSPNSGFPLAQLIKDELPEIDNVTRISFRSYLVQYGTDSYRLPAALVDPGFLEMFSFQFVKGRPDALFEGMNSMVITRQFAERFFSGEDPIGKVFTVNNNTELIVTGIIENVPENSHIQFEYLLSLKIFPRLFGVGDDYLDSWAHDSATYLLLKNNVSLTETAEKISDITKRNDELAKNKTIPMLQPITQIHLRNPNGTDPIIYVYILSAIAISILLIACVNYMNLATARSAKRAKEIGMRKVVGARKRDIINQFFGESVLSTLFALAAAVVLVYLFIPNFNSLTGKNLEIDFVHDLSLLFSFLSIAVFTGVISGSYPALLLSSFLPIRVLKGSSKANIREIILRRILVTGQFTVTIILIVSTMVVYNQLEYIRNKDLGLNKDQVIAVRLNRSARGSYHALKNELKKHPGIIQVTAATSLPTEMHSVNPVYWEGKTKEDFISINWATVDYDYFELFEMEMLHGRKFSRDFPTDNRNYIINEEALKMTGLKEPIGKMFSYWENEGEIIGVVKNFHNRSLHSKITPTVFIFTQSLYAIGWTFIKIEPDNIPEMIDFIKNTSSDIAPDLHFDYQFLDEAFDSRYRSDMQTGTLFKYSSILAIFISCLGLLGMVSFMTQERSKEIGVRKVLGASIKSIITLISKEFLTLIIVSSAVAWPVSFILIKIWLNSFAYKADPGISLYLCSTVIALAISLITVGFHIFKAALANPVNSLRYE
ncbi:ABC transporter permease [candidate division KSB1 bacterium]